MFTNTDKNFEKLLQSCYSLMTFLWLTYVLLLFSVKCFVVNKWCNRWICFETKSQTHTNNDYIFYELTVFDELSESFWKLFGNEFIFSQFINRFKI
jgi:hypothetical protein